jgi:hypothetical protein
MSSDHVWIRNSEWNRVQREAQRVQQAESEAQAIQERAAAREWEISQQYTAQVNSINDRLNAMSRRHTGELQRVSDDFRNRLTQQSGEFTREMNRQRTEFQGDLRALETRMGNEIGRLDVNIRAVDGKVNEIAQDFSNRFNELSRRENDRKIRAALNIKELAELLEAIRGLRPEKFEPGKLRELEQRLPLIEGNMQNGDYEAVIASAQEGVLDAGRLLSRLAILNNLFNERLREVRNRSNEIGARIESFGAAANNAVQFTIDGENYRFDYDIAYWSHGQFEALRGRFAEVSGQVDEADTSSVDMDGLERLMHELNHVDADVTECDAVARTEMIGSCVVEDTAIRIHNVLAGQGWRKQETGHHNADSREPYRMIYADGSGNELAIVVNSGDTPDTPQFMIDVFAEGRGETYRRITKEGLLNGLQEAGMKIPEEKDKQPEHKDDCAENPDARTFIQNKVPEAVRRNEQRRERATARR